MKNPITEIMLVRHGETAWNAEGRIQGHLDIPLNSTGLAQAEAVGQRLAAEEFHVIYSSDLNRAYRTALPIGLNRPVERRAELREQHLGVLQGLTHAEAKIRHREAWESFTTRSTLQPIEGGEGLAVFATRVMDFIDECVRKHSGERLLLVTHGGVLDVLYRHAHGKPLSSPRDFPIYNASINVLRHCEGSWLAVSWGDIDHLAQERALDDL
ncbi:MAG: histidine phosphatase family protein [Burkholderiales bacterium]